MKELLGTLQLRRLALLAVFLAAAFTWGAAPAWAGIYDGGGSGGGSTGGGGGMYGISPTYWVYAPTASAYANPNSSPYPWGQRPVYGNSAYDYQGGVGVRAAIGDLQPQCMAPNVKAVFAQQIHGTTSSWRQFRWGVNKYEHAGGTYGTLLNLYKNGGGNDPLVISQLQAESSTPLPLKTVICVTADEMTEWREAPVYEGAEDEVELTCVYSKASTVSRQLSSTSSTGEVIDPIGKNNLHNQPAKFVKTPYGVELDKLQATGVTSPLEALALLEEACAQSAGTASPRLELTEANQEGLAEGGVLNVKETEQTATFRASQEYQRLADCVAREYRSTDGGATWLPTGKTRECTGDYPEEKERKPVDFETELEKSQNLTGFWQIISVHCNKEEWDALVAATPGIEVVNTGDANGVYSALAYSQVYGWVPPRLDFGDPTHPNTANQRTGDLGFYDKECPFECTADPEGPGATPENGATENVGNTTPEDGTADPRYGAVSGVHNASEFTFFRDNKPRGVTLDVWYPQAGGVVSYDGSEPLTTTVNRWAEGTPSLDGNDGGHFTFKTKDGEKLFTGGNSPRELKNWDKTKYSNETTTVLEGLVRDFTAQATWASEPEKPHVLSVRWEYEAGVTTRFPTYGIGFLSDGSAARGALQVRSTPLQGQCNSTFGQDSTNSTVEELGKNTGSGTDNKLDEVTHSDPAAVEHFILRFVRATSE